MSMKYTKYHALGNDYLVIRPADLKTELTPEQIRLVCHRNYGAGSDGILLGPLASKSCDFGVKIYNPDGSEAEKSGNGIRIFARSLVDDRLSKENTFSLETAGGKVHCEVSEDAKTVRVEMGAVSFWSEKIPVAGRMREVLREQLEVDGASMLFCAATVGNPHCIVLSENPSPEETHRIGPKIENHPLFPNRTNVQFMKVLDRANIQIEIWERGAGYTLASGSSSTAAAAIARKLGLCDAEITVHTPGGEIKIELNDDFHATMTGAVRKVCEGVMVDEAFEEKMAP